MEDSKVRTESVDSRLGQLGEGLPAELRRNVENLAREMLARRPPTILGRLDTDSLRGICLTLLELGRERERAALALRIFDPQQARSPWPSTWTALAVVTDDHPFIIDSIAGELSRRGLRIEREVRARIAVRRGPRGRLMEILGAERVDSPPGDDGLESWLLLELDGPFDEETRHELAARLVQVLADARAAVEDWAPMRARLQSVSRQLERMVKSGGQRSQRAAEVWEFTQWLLGDHFTFLAFCQEPAGEDGVVGLGLWRENRERWDGEMVGARRHDEVEPRVEVRKSHQRSSVHRPVPMDLISITVFSAEGETVLYRFAGLFTSRAYLTPANKIPILRHKIAQVLDRAGLSTETYDSRRLRHVLETYPRDELFQVGEEELLRNALLIHELELRPRPALFVRHDPNHHQFHCLGFVPRETGVQKVLSLLELTLDGTVVSANTFTLDSPPLTRLQILVKGRESAVAPPDLKALEVQLIAAVTPFHEKLRQQLIATRGERRGLTLWHRYRDAFPVTYMESEGLEETDGDIEALEESAQNGRLGVRLKIRSRSEGGRYLLRVFEPTRPAHLSEVLPTLDHLGFAVVAESSYEVCPGGGALAPSVWVTVFALETPSASWEEDEEGSCRRLEEAFLDIRGGSLEDDPFNRLLLAAGLDGHQVTLLRALARYLRQARSPFSLHYMANALERNPRVARGLVQLFVARFDPEREGRDDGDRDSEGLRALLLEELDKVQSLDEDRILRRFVNLIEATVRSNYFQRGEDGQPKPYLALKLDPTRIRELPLPRPVSEIFVYSPTVEAVHLRSSRVARGGIRWSDRLEDFRTEILGLLKAQMVKNTTIVASGAKGGFVVRRPPSTPDREAWLAAGIAAYRTMLHGLLDVTDNRQGERIVPPPRTLRRDGEDSYLVVAADKGTAAFSDIANALACERGFWLSDAFASGGSAGYDHKQLGITARGAWESVKRHFREIGRDIDKEPITVVGVGDMSGDVFGNGMLLSRQIRLVAAFNHLHIFVDPDPDPELSWRERRRLFELPRSSWTDYDPALLSSGGGVYDRGAKFAEIGPEISALFDLPMGRLAPAELLRTILKARVDLLWLAGIGTYVKASGETNAEVGDRFNDALRIDANELRVAVVGEGANLGLTQGARVEYALGGGRLNTDALDNGGGVQCSDLEVNIKIVLEEALRAEKLDPRERDSLLAEMAQEVAERVLELAYEQGQAVSLMELRASASLDEHEHRIRELERRGLLDRRIEGLPDDQEFERRRATYRGLTRPEIAVFLAYAKLDLFQALQDTALAGAPGLYGELLAYFPATLGDRFRHEVEQHRLRRQIVASQLTRWTIHRLGPTLVRRLCDRDDTTPDRVVAACLLAREALATEDLWRQVEALDNRAPTTLQYVLQLEIADALEAVATWLLDHWREIASLSTPERTLACWIRRVVVEGAARELTPELEQRVVGFERLRAPAELARRVANLAHTVDLFAQALHHGQPDPEGDADPLLLDLGRCLLQTKTADSPR